MPETRRGLRWRSMLLLWAAFLLLAGLIGCLVLYRYLAVYEQTRPELYMERLLETTPLRALAEQAEPEPDLPVTAYEDAQALYAQVLSGLDLDAPPRYEKEKRLSSAERAVFTLKAGPSRVCTVTLVSEGPRLPFGRHAWRLERVSSGDFTGALRSAELWIYALEGQALRLNGKLLTADCRVDGEAPADLTQLERGFSPPTAFARYRVAPLYGELSLCDAEGRPVELRADGESGFVANAAALQRRDLVVSAPEGLRVLVGGQTLDEGLAAYDAGILEGLSSVVAADYRLARYVLPGVYGEVELSAVDAGGERLEPVRAASGDYRFYYPNDPEAEAALRPAAERFFQSFIAYTSAAFSEARYMELLSRVRPGTALYDYIAQSRDAMIWAPSAQTDFSQLRFDNFHYLNSRCFLCTVRYDADLSYSARSEDYRFGMQNAYELAFQLADTGWIALAMSSIQ